MVLPHATKSLLKMIIFVLWPKMKFEKKHKSLLHIVIFFHNFAAFRLSVIEGCLEQFSTLFVSPENYMFILIYTALSENENGVGIPLSYVFQSVLLEYFFTDLMETF